MTTASRRRISAFDRCFLRVPCPCRWWWSQLQDPPTTSHFSHYHDTATSTCPQCPSRSMTGLAACPSSSHQPSTSGLRGRARLNSTSSSRILASPQPGSASMSINGKEHVMIMMMMTTTTMILRFLFFSDYVRIVRKETPFVTVRHYETTQDDVRAEDLRWFS